MASQHNPAMIPSEPGGVALVRVEPRGEQTQTALFIRDRTETITTFGRPPALSGRFRGVDWRQKVFVVVIALRIRTPQDPVSYTLWVNLRATPTSTVPFVDLAVQPNVIFQFFGDGGSTITACMIKNPFQEFSRTLLQQLPQFPAWSPGQFEDAVTELRGRYPSPAALWEALGIPDAKP
jgi:hypothetical protein